MSLDEWFVESLGYTFETLKKAHRSGGGGGGCLGVVEFASQVSGGSYPDILQI